MSSDNKHKRQIIVKRAHAAHDDEHGGQWKIAYADFVTAMMAFFLVMWLLSSTTEVQKEGIAKFFTSSNSVDMPAGTGMLEGGRSVMTAGASRQESPESAEGGVAQNEDSGAAAREANAQTADGSGAAARDRIERQRLDAMKAEFERQMLTDQGELHSFASSILVEMTPEGLRLQLFDREGAPMFLPASAEPTPRLSRMLGVVGSVLASVPNEVVVAGHTDAQPLGRGSYGNWELSTDRANNSRRVLERSGLLPGRVFRVEGKAASEPLFADQLTDPRNRRIVITVLRSEAVAAARNASAAQSGASSSRR
ncbi:flagellar motor protein MotB [Belnapia moabensis]|uniref:flagellar motor protein MotB n=1 Tax=Belnapia moabensis TaxID=365533 RepID=UPI0005B95631|nr:flagellar motor protein MotB [Belnapia moabensis]